MASFDTGATKLLDASDKAVKIATKKADGSPTETWLPRKFVEYKPDGDGRLRVYVQSWFAKRIGLTA